MKKKVNILVPLAIVALVGAGLVIKSLKETVQNFVIEPDDRSDYDEREF